MKKYICMIICLFGFFCLTQMVLSTKLFAADYTVKVSKYSKISSISENSATIMIKTICIDGYKFLITYTPAHSDESSPALNTIQMYEKVSGMIYPMQCGK